jgi:hypothetical protein
LRTERNGVGAADVPGPAAHHARLVDRDAAAARTARAVRDEKGDRRTRERGGAERRHEQPVAPADSLREPLRLGRHG